MSIAAPYHVRALNQFMPALHHVSRIVSPTTVPSALYAGDRIFHAKFFGPPIWKRGVKAPKTPRPTRGLTIWGCTVVSRAVPQIGGETVKTNPRCTVTKPHMHRLAYNPNPTKYESPHYANISRSCKNFNKKCCASCMRIIGSVLHHAGPYKWRLNSGVSRPGDPPPDEYTTHAIQITLMRCCLGPLDHFSVTC